MKHIDGDCNFKGCTQKGQWRLIRLVCTHNGLAATATQEGLMPLCDEHYRELIDKFGQRKPCQEHI